jgi:hypothetical protein
MGGGEDEEHALYLPGVNQARKGLGPGPPDSGGIAPPDVVIPWHRIQGRIEALEKTKPLCPNFRIRGGSVEYVSGVDHTGDGKGQPVDQFHNPFQPIQAPGLSQMRVRDLDEPESVTFLGSIRRKRMPLHNKKGEAEQETPAGTSPP